MEQDLAACSRASQGSSGCARTWLMLAMRLASKSGVISYPYLYRKLDASLCARCTCDRASAAKEPDRQPSAHSPQPLRDRVDAPILPVMTHPMVGVMLKMCEIESGSSSLSCKSVERAGQRASSSGGRAPPAQRWAGHARGPSSV